MSSSDQQTQPSTLTHVSSTDSLNHAQIMSLSDVETTPPSRNNSRFSKENMKTLPCLYQTSYEQNFSQLLTKSIEKCRGEVLQVTPGPSQIRTVEVKMRLSGKFQKQCPICLGEYQLTRGSLGCLHQFCFQCIQKWCQSSTICPCCRTPITSILKLSRLQPEGPVTQTLRISVQKKQLLFQSDYDHYLCYQCGRGDDQHVLLICDGCDFYCCHVYCDEELNNQVPGDDWFCIYCRNSRRVRNRRRGRGNQGFISLEELEISYQEDSLEYESSQGESQKGVAARTRSHQVVEASGRRNTAYLLRNMRSSMRGRAR